MDFRSEKLLLVDIGGTNFRSAISYLGSDEVLETKKQNVECLENFSSLVNDLLEEHGPIEHAVFSVAGPKINNVISMTNRNFEINAEAIQKQFGFKSCYLLNDWESIGFSLAGTKKSDIQFIQEGKPFNDTAFMIGPGTGLGAAFISNDVVFPTEVGNTQFTFQQILADAGVTNVHQFKVLEDLLSGRGISRLYENFSGVLNSPEDVVRLCKDKDQNAVKAIDTFIDSLAIAISDMALTYMPGRGIFVAGGLMRTIYNFIDHKRFINSFIGQRKSMHQDLLQQMPIGIITREMTCLHGNLAFLTSQLMKS